ncbi:hypothetical protein ACQ4LE_005516 [Meloidogyne hapla]|uniref:KIX domain-containing protein n=1 Tax=Meloidogyne hapla TaxID=6305 RepID=A0A1I8BN50_MELHA
MEEIVKEVIEQVCEKDDQNKKEEENQKEDDEENGREDEGEEKSEDVEEGHGKEGDEEGLEEYEEIEIKREENLDDEKDENNLEIEEEEEESTDSGKIKDDYSTRGSSSGDRQSFKIMEFVDFNEIKKEHQDEEEIEEKFPAYLNQNISQQMPKTLTQSKQSNGGIYKSNVTSQQQQRPKRNRARRLYTPSPPPRFGGESKRKRERSDDSLASTSLQTLPNSKKISWAKEPPRQVHSANKPQSDPALPPQSQSSSQQSIDSTFPSSSSSSHFAPHPPVIKSGHSIPTAASKPPSTFGYSHQQTQMQTVQQAQHVIVLLRQNEKLAKEVAQLKRLNQEQQQQIQSLISANRELIWAFNESRREHEELMKQLKTLMASNNNNNSKNNNNINGNVVEQTGGTSNSNNTSNQMAQQKPAQKVEIVVPKRILSKTSKSDLQRREKKHQSGNVGGLISKIQHPPSFSVLNKSQKSKVDNKMSLRTSKSQQQLFPDVPSERKPSIKNVVNLSSIELKKEEEETTQILPEFEQKKRTKEEKIESIKDELNILKSNPDSSKFLGLRRPAFFTPKEFGDWHSVVSGDLRKQLVLKIFQALCPEVTQNCIDDYNKAYPSRVDYIKKSVDFSFETENELFISANSKDDYIGFIAEKIFTLREAISRFSTTTATSSGSNEGSDSDERRSNNNNNGTVRRKLADLFKRKRNVIGTDE